MKLIKIKFAFTIALMSLILISCSSDNNPITENSSNNSISNPTEINNLYKGSNNSIYTNDGVEYRINSIDNKISRFSQGVLQYDIANNHTSAELEINNTNESYTIKNSQNSNETIKFYNIEVVNDSLLKFSFKTNLGVTVDDMFFESDMGFTNLQGNAKFCWPCVTVLVEVVAVVVDMVTSGPTMDMTQVCLAQMQACLASGGTPTNMQASSSWWGGDDCSLTCVKN